MTDPIVPGAFIEIRYPFVLEDVDPWFEGIEGTMKSWRPGVRYQLVPPDDSEAVADAHGTMIMTVVSIHKPAHYPERVFYTRRWRSPLGKEFGKPRLIIVTAEKFRRLARGYQHKYRLIDNPPASCMRNIR